MCDISVRKYIRWLPDEPSEPTSTIVLTTPERRFVDVRVLTQTDDVDVRVLTQTDNVEDAILPSSRLDWAMAGTSSSSMTPSSDGGPGTRHSRWYRWIDSRTANAEEVVDEGDMFDVPSDPALTLERGRMVNPATGQDADYEEMWWSEPVETAPGANGAVTCLALRWEGAEDGAGRVQRGLVVRLGQYCQAFARDGEAITVERLKWDAGRLRWVTQVRIGRQELPTAVATYFAHEAMVDDEVKAGSAVWKVIERA